MSDEQGKVTETVAYDAYGTIVERTGNTKTSFLYVGQYGIQLEENGLQYMRARYYNPEIGRFIHENPARDGFNWYAYADNNPVNYINPLGMWPELSNKTKIALGVLAFAGTVAATVLTVGLATSITAAVVTQAVFQVGSAVALGTAIGAFVGSTINLVKEAGKAAYYTKVNGSTNSKG